MAMYAAPIPLVGTWRLDSQEVNGQRNSEPLTLRITQSGDKLNFAFSVPVNNVYFVSMSYAVKLDGSEADVKNADGEKIGTVQITRAGPLPNEQDRVPGGPSGRSIHSRQLFSRY